MDVIIWEEKYKDTITMTTFYNMFGGRFLIDAEDATLYYQDKNRKPLKVPIDEIEYWDMVIQSVKQKKNLFLNQEKVKEMIINSLKKLEKEWSEQ